MSKSKSRIVGIGIYNGKNKTVKMFQTKDQRIADLERLVKGAVPLMERSQLPLGWECKARKWLSEKERICGK